MMASTANENKKKNQDEEPEPDYTKLLDDIKEKIIEVISVRDSKDTADSDLHAKSAIQILHEIELNIDTFMKELQYIHKGKEGAT